MAEPVHIWKYHGTGNDFVMLEDLDDERPLDPRLVAALCDRHLGVGGDGVIRVTRGRAPDEDFFMDYRNADGSLAEMCGNGIRCLGKLVYEHGLTPATELRVGSRGGAKTLALSVTDGVVGSVTVGMGAPAFERSRIPMAGPTDGTFLGQSFELGGRTLVASAVSMGNPHLVLFVQEDPAGMDVRTVGPSIEHDPRFPEGTNVEFAEVGPDGIRARVWERGSGETMACGTGACAVVVAASEAGLVPSVARVRFPGGELVVERTEADVFLTGPAERVFEATIDPAWLEERVLG